MCRWEEVVNERIGREKRKRSKREPTQNLFFNVTLVLANRCSMTRENSVSKLVLHTSTVEIELLLQFAKTKVNLLVSVTL